MPTAADNQAVIAQYLAGHGLTSPQIAGVLGNLQVESNFNPTAANPREGAIGIAQWEGGRRTALQNYARSIGGTETDLSSQLGFMWQELNGSESGALTALTAATTPAAAATAFDQKYERSSAASLPARVTAAQTIAAGGVAGGSGTVTGATPAGWLGDAAGAAAGGIWDGLVSALAPVGRLVVDAGLVLIGAVLVIVGLVLIARAQGMSTPTLPATGDAGGGGGQDAGKGAAGKGAAGEAAEVAAL